MNTSNTPYSPFASALRSLLEDTRRFTRDGWCRFLGISSPAISQWLSDDTLPKADHLRRILDQLERTRGSHEVNNEPLMAFRALCDRPAVEVTPAHERVGPTLGHYILGPLRENVLRMLGTLPMAHQEIVLDDAMVRVSQALNLGDAFTGASHLHRLRTRYPSGTVLQEHDLVAFFSWGQWKRVLVIGLDPLELAGQPRPSETSRPVRADATRSDLFSTLVRAQLDSTSVTNERRFVYVLPKDSSGGVENKLRDLFWDPELVQRQQINMHPYLLQLDADVVNHLLTVGAVREQQPVLIVSFDDGKAPGIGYAWFVDGHSEHGVVLSQERLRELSQRLKDLGGDSEAQAIEAKVA